MRAMYCAAHRSGIPGCSARRTYERVVKPFGSTAKKLVRIEGESWEKNVICSGSRGIRK